MRVNYRQACQEVVVVSKNAIIRFAEEDYRLFESTV